MGQISSKGVFKQFYPTGEETQVILRFIKEGVEKGFDWYKEHRPRNWGKLVMQFFMLPKTSLHKEFREKIFMADRDITIKEETISMERTLNWNIQDMADNDPNQNWEYQCMNKFRVEGINHMRIGIAEVQNNGKIKRHKVEVISQNKTPSLYIKYM